MPHSSKLLPALLLLWPALAPAQTSTPWPADAAKHRFHMIGQAHIDPVWLWPWTEGLSEVHSTFRSALDRMNETPKFCFTASSAQFYQWVAENDPAMLAEIKKRVAEGRWDVPGGWWVEPDVNIPSGEALMRQGLYGQLTLRHLLGKTSTVGYNPDTFGHPGTLPQIYKLQGISNYVFMRPEPREKTLPGNLFWWQSPDGTRVLTYRIPFSYNDERSVDARIQRTLKEWQMNSPSQMAFYGAGDHGGGATKTNTASINALIDDKAAPTVLYSTTERYFNEVRAGDTKALPVVADDLQHHSVGCYTAECGIKKGNRAAELALTSAEKIASVGSLAWGAAYPRAEFTEAWKKVLLLQFHDSLAGTSLPEHYFTAVPAGHGYAMEVATRATYMAAQKLAWAVPTKDPDSEYLVAFNVNPWPVTANVEYDLAVRPGTPARVEDETGAAIPNQWLPPTSEVRGRQRLVARVAIPAFGYRQIRVRKNVEQKVASGVQASAQGLENELLKVAILADGAIQIFDKKQNRQVFTSAGGARGLVMDDPSDTWSHDVKAYDKQIGAFEKPVVTVLENGPLRGHVQVRTKYGASTLTTEWLLYAGAATLEARVTLDWHERLKMLKLSFPVDVQNARATYEVPFGTIVRPPNGDEEPGQRWLDVAGEAGGLTVINDAKYGYSVAGNDLRVSIVRSSPYAHHRPQVLDMARDHLWMDQGVQSMRLLLAPHAGTWQDAGVARLTEEFTNPLPIVWQGIHAGTRPQSASFASIDAPNVMLAAIKQAEAGDDLIVRCYETAGRATKTALNVAGHHWTGEFKPYEIKTLRMDRRSGAFKAVNGLEE